MGDKLKELRHIKNLTQKQVASRIGVAVSAVSSYESGERYPSYDVLIKLARMYHVSTDYLLGLTDAMPIDAAGLNKEDIMLVSQLIDRLRNQHVKSPL